MTDEWMSDFFVVRKRIRNDERLILMALRHFLSRRKRTTLCDSLEYDAHETLRFRWWCVACSLSESIV